MLILFVFAMVATFTLLIMAERLSVLIVLILVLIAFVLIGGFAADLGPMMLDGIRTLAPIGVMLMSAVLYFAIMIDSGLFDPVVHGILRLVKGDLLKVSLDTVTLTVIVSLDDDGSTTYMICIAAVLPLYSCLGMSPLVVACLTMLSSGMLNMTPRDGSTARAVGTLHVDPADIFVPTTPAMIVGLLVIFTIVWIYGKRECAHLDELHLPTDHEDLAEISVSQCPETHRPRLLWFNVTLIVVPMATLIVGLLPMPVLFMIVFGITIIADCPCIQEQKKRIDTHTENILAVVSLTFAAGVLTGILSGTGVVDAMFRSLLAVIPPVLGPYLATIITLVGMPFAFFISDDAFYYGVLPVLTQAAAEYGITPTEIARAPTAGQPVHLPSPLVPSAYLLVGLAKIDFGDHQRFTLKWAILVYLAILTMVLLLGLLPLLSN